MAFEDFVIWDLHAGHHKDCPFEITDKAGNIIGVLKYFKPPQLCPQ